MADVASLDFLAADGSLICTLTVYMLGNWSPETSGVEPLITIAADQAKDDGEGQVQLLEGVRYEYALSESQFRLSLAQQYTAPQGIVLQSRVKDRGHCGVLNPGLATGRIPLVVSDSSGAEMARSAVEVRSRKLSYKADYRQMLDDITARCMDLLQELKAPSLFKAEPDPGNDPATMGQRFAFVRGLLQSPGFVNALHRITTHPHKIWQHEAHSGTIGRGFKPSGKVLRQLAQGNRRLALPTAHPLHSSIESLPEFITVNRAIPTEDTPENRFVKFALRSFHSFLDTMSRRIVDKAKDARLVQEIAALSSRLDEALDSAVLRHVSEPKFLPVGSPTMQRREGYREVLQAWLNFAMAAKLVWHGGEQVFGAGQRDVATLYEYWVFFKLLEVVTSVFQLEMPTCETLLEQTADGFGLKLKAGKFIFLKGQSAQPGRTLEVQFSYNRSFRATQTPRMPGSWTENLRPDYTLSLWPASFSAEEAELQELMVHVHFDAKYRIDEIAALLNNVIDTTTLDDDALASVLDAEKRSESGGTYKRADLLKMHAYRDAIRRTQGAYVIYPGQAGADTRLRSFHEVLPGLGAFALRPGMGTTILETFLRDVVSHVADRASAREQNSFHTWQTYRTTHPVTAQEDRAAYLVAPEKGTSSNLRNSPLRETFVLVAWAKGDVHLQWILKERKYNFRMGNASGALRLSSQVIGASYLLLHGVNGRAVPGLLRIINPSDGPQVYSKSELEAMDYPTEPTQNAYLVYDVEPAEEFSHTAWDYAALLAKSATAPHGYPFAISLQDLLPARKR
jgi:hypothetical protein